MSRIGQKPVKLLDGVKVDINDRMVTLEGPLGKLHRSFEPEISIRYDDETKEIHVARNSDARLARALHGTTRALIQNMVLGVKEGFQKRLEIVGVGYLAAVDENTLQLRVGFANEVHMPIPEGLSISCPDQSHIVIQGADKQRVGQFAAEVRAVRKPEPYKGKGIRYDGEQVKRKAGKAMVK